MTKCVQSAYLLPTSAHESLNGLVSPGVIKFFEGGIFFDASGTVLHIHAIHVLNMFRFNAVESLII